MLTMSTDRERLAHDLMRTYFAEYIVYDAPDPASLTPVDEEDEEPYEPYDQEKDGWMSHVHCLCMTRDEQDIVRHLYQTQRDVFSTLQALEEALTPLGLAHHIVRR